LDSNELERIINENKSQEYGLNDIPSTLLIGEVQKYRNYAIEFGLSSTEVDKLIQWQIRPLYPKEENALAELVRIVGNMNVDKETYDREWPRVYRSYIAIMSVNLMVEKFGVDHEKLPSEKVMPYLKMLTESIMWQLTEMQHFMLMAFCMCPIRLEVEPVQIPSASFAEEPKREKTQAEMIDEAAHELANLPRFTAYAKVIDEREGKQVVINNTFASYEKLKEG
jgi:hypothetical protein